MYVPYVLAIKGLVSDILRLKRMVTTKKTLLNVNIESLPPDILFSLVHFRSLKQENPFTFLGELDLLLSSPSSKT